MQSGKRMGAARKDITVTMRRPEPCIMCDDATRYTNRIVFTLEPSDRIEIVFYAKKPGFEDEVEERTFSFFLYEKTEKAQYVEEYAKLIYDAFAGDQTLFVSTREIDAGWRFIDPIVDGWEEGLVPLATYPPDTDSIVAACRTGAGGGSRREDRSRSRGLARWARASLATCCATAGAWWAGTATARSRRRWPPRG